MGMKQKCELSAWNDDFEKTRRMKGLARGKHGRGRFSAPKAEAASVRLTAYGKYVKMKNKKSPRGIGGARF